VSGHVLHRERSDGHGHHVFAALACEEGQGVRARHAGAVPELGGRQLESLATEEIVRRPRAAGYRVAAFTVNDAARARVLLGQGVDCLITDDPGAILAAVAADSDGGLDHDSDMRSNRPHV